MRSIVQVLFGATVKDRSFKRLVSSIKTCISYCFSRSMSRAQS